MIYLQASKSVSFHFIVSSRQTLSGREPFSLACSAEVNSACAFAAPPHPAPWAPPPRRCRAEPFSSACSAEVNSACAFAAPPHPAPRPPPRRCLAGTLFLSMLGGSEFRLRFCGSAAPRSAGPAAQTLSGREPFSSACSAEVNSACAFAAPPHPAPRAPPPRRCLGGNPFSTARPGAFRTGPYLFNQRSSRK